MTCPHCSASLTRKQRTNVTCDLCKKEFAFEPKDHSMGLNDLRFRKMAERLGGDGVRYTASQLRLALSRKPATTTGGRYAAALIFGAFGITTLVVAAVNHDNGKGMAIGLALLIGAFIALGSALNVPGPQTDFTFQFEVLERWRAVYGELPKGLIDETSLAGLNEEDRPRHNLFGVVVCPERDLLTCLLVNGVPRDLRLGLLSTAAPVDDWEKSLLELLRKSPRLPILLLHDASARDAFLAPDLPQLLGISAEHRIFDLGLNPKKSIAKNRFVIQQAIPPEVLARLDREALGADVAGSRPIRRGRAQVSGEELGWLRAGNCSPILAVPPGSLIKRLKFALDKISPKPKPAKAADAGAAVGFMSGPA